MQPPHASFERNEKARSIIKNSRLLPETRAKMLTRYHSASCKIQTLKRRLGFDRIFASMLTEDDSGFLTYPDQDFKIAAPGGFSTRSTDLAHTCPRFSDSFRRFTRSHYRHFDF